VALVIGNSAYVESTPLPNAASDAELIATQLRAVGIEVHKYQDLDKPGMDNAIQKFTARLSEIDGVDSAIFYFSGHGFQEGGKNYLLPICGDNDQADVVNLQAWIVSMSELSRRRLIFLDACRIYFDETPIKDAIARTRALDRMSKPDVNRGLADFEAPDDTFISFSAAPGEPAYDGIGDSENSPYAEALARYVQEVDLPLTVMMARIRNSVRSDTEHLRSSDNKPAPQNTWESSSLWASFFFNPSSAHFFWGNILSFTAAIVAMAALSVVAFETAVADYFGKNGWILILISLGVFGLSIVVFLFGIGRAYSRVRGENSNWLRADKFSLMSWSSGGWLGAQGGILGGIIAPALVIMPYWYDWRTMEDIPYIAAEKCADHHWADPFMPPLCPKLGELLAEGSVAGIYNLSILGFLTMHFIEWMTRGWPSNFIQVRHSVLVVVGAMLGGVLAGVMVGPVVTAYFGSLNRPFIEPGFVTIPL